jgi:hypothetical protein
MCTCATDSSNTSGSAPFSFAIFLRAVNMMARTLHTTHTFVTSVPWSCSAVSLNTVQQASMLWRWRALKVTRAQAEAGQRTSSGGRGVCLRGRRQLPSHTARRKRPGQHLAACLLGPAKPLTTGAQQR